MTESVKIPESVEKASGAVKYAFTIAARNFIAQATVLYQSLIEHNPDVKFYFALCDEDVGINHDSLPFEIITLRDLDDDRVWAMSERYNVTEFCTSIKPLVFTHLMKAHPGGVVCYFDPDIFIVSELTELWEAFDVGAQAVLTPHAVAPSPRPELFADENMLKYGTYNLGFLGMRATEPARQLMAWWADVLEEKCVIDLPNGLFVDQKWADLLPAFLDDVKVLRHPGYNVAYWNMLGRRATIRDGQWEVNGEPFRFMHFSGHEITKPSVFSRHGWFLDQHAIGDLERLLAIYRQKIIDAGFFDFAKFRYGFSWAGATGMNYHTPVAISDTLVEGGGRIGKHLSAFDGTVALPAANGNANGAVGGLWSVSVSSWHEFARLKPEISRHIADQQVAERALVPAGVDHFTLQGICSICRTDSSFVVGNMYSLGTMPDGRFVPNWREHLACITCGFTNRIRAAMHYLQVGVAPPARADIYVTERATSLFDWLQLRWPNAQGSEFFSPEHEKGRMYDGIRHEDVCSLTFADDSFDIVMSFDVLEHVEDLELALSELYRVLRPGGTLLFAAATQFEQRETYDRVFVREDGAYDYLVEPEYRGDSDDAKDGALCFRNLGLDVLDRLRTLGFAEAEYVVYSSNEYRFMGPFQNFCVARKPKVAADIGLLSAVSQPDRTAIPASAVA